MPDPPPLPAPLLEQTLAETRKMAGHLGIELPGTAEVFGPAFYFEIFSASAADGFFLNEDARDGWPFYLVVLRGHFVSERLPGPPRPFATLIWSPAESRREFTFRDDLPASLSQLGTPNTISLDSSGG